MKKRCERKKDVNEKKDENEKKGGKWIFSHEICPNG